MSTEIRKSIATNVGNVDEAQIKISSTRRDIEQANLRPVSRQDNWAPDFVDAITQMKIAETLLEQAAAILVQAAKSVEINEAQPKD